MNLLSQTESEKPKEESEIGYYVGAFLAFMFFGLIAGWIVEMML